MNSVAYVGLDVHKDTIRVAVLPETGTAFLQERTIPTDGEALRRALAPWQAMSAVTCFYEASSCGYTVQRWLAQAGIACTVVAPSKVPRAAGDRVKTDRRDARALATQGRAGTLAAVRVPTEAEEAVQGLVRQRAAQRDQLRGARQRVQAFLLLRHQVYAAGEPWTQQHWRWLRALRWTGLDREVFAEYLAEVTDLEHRVATSEARMRQVAETAPYAASVARLGCFRGITVERALVLIAETGDFHRFARAEPYMSYVGLVSSEHSSGGRRRQGAITKAGNPRLRHELVEAAWGYRHTPAVGVALRRRQADQSAAIIALAWRAQRRLNRTYWHLIAAHKESGVAVTAVARELAGFIWAAMTLEE